MKTAAACFVLLAAAAHGHRLDEYLQATTISLDKDKVRIQLTLTPGVAMFPLWMAGVDTDRDGAISKSEESGYARAVVNDLALSLDGIPLHLQFADAHYSTLEEFRDGLGEIQIDLDTELPETARERKLVFENHHHPAVSAYLVNCLLPQDPGIRVLRQDRNYEQSAYRLEYVQDGGARNENIWLCSLVGLLLARLATYARSAHSQTRSRQ